MRKSRAAPEPEAMASANGGTLVLARGERVRLSCQQRAQRVVDEHAAIVSALRERDPERARIAMQFHLAQARQRLIDRTRDR